VLLGLTDVNALDFAFFPIHSNSIGWRAFPLDLLDNVRIRSLKDP
jgi:hypothetical protein